MWYTEARIVEHPNGKGFAIEVALKYGYSSYKALVTGIGKELEAVPRGYKDESPLALRFDGLLGYCNAKKAFADVNEVFSHGGLGGLWPRCINCLSYLRTGDGKLNRLCEHCGYNNPW